MNPLIDAYLQEGCGRCPLGGTPECKVHSWQEELKYLRRLILECGLTEEQKWGMPTYTHNGTNLVMVAAFKDNCTLSFFKGALLKDDHQILEKPGENTQSGRVVRFTDVKQIVQLEPVLKSYIFEAIEVKKAGLKVQMKPVSDYDIPEEFQQRLEEDPELKKAFENLTPGRQKGYLLYFSGAKQSKTREDRIEKYIPKIMKGLGFHDR
ncbi:YdeI/OmpD-associated family protein [Flagellimonas amoyensis]|uniref:YdeI/OmpD-associated family protein n=1 Tax=Flagellimonas amoyensis TaxID=2169401 RepID=UPI000D3B05B8|nr:YdeI/OmpD-associated family protein [Allomuricauda amoyensis]